MHPTVSSPCSSRGTGRGATEEEASSGGGQGERRTTGSGGSEGETRSQPWCTEPPNARLGAPEGGGEGSWGEEQLPFLSAGKLCIPVVHVKGRQQWSWPRDCERRNQGKSLCKAKRQSCGHSRCHDHRDTNLPYSQYLWASCSNNPLYSDY